jgi:formate hydrogenlyase subunit 3/multisubunit Na+/H+ antiporter MnhD subunit
VTSVASSLPLLALLPSALAVPLIVLSRRRPAIRETWSVVAAVAQTVVVIAMVPVVLSGIAPVARPLPLAPGIPLELRADPAGILFALVASALWVLTTVYSIGYTRAEGEARQTRYFAAFALCLFATVGIALAGNLLTFFVFYELLTVAGYPLVIHRETPEAVRAGRIYLAYTLGGGVALLAATVWTVALTGHGTFVAGGILGATGASPAALWALAGLFVLGCGVKAALLPLHTWLPLAMVAPTPVSALLHAVAVVKAGVFGVVRVTGFVFGTDLLAELGAGRALAAVAVATIVLASLAALAQDNLKRLLAFSTIGQLSYVVLGVALGPRDAFTGGVMHMSSHALMKITLFFCAGAIAATTHFERVSQLTGIGRRMPVTMAAFALAAFMLAGLPPGAGFVSKWLLLLGSVETSAWLAVAALLASTVLNIAYFAPIVVRAWMPPPAPSPIAEAPATMLVPLVLTAVAALVVGLAPDGLAPLLALARAASGIP